MPRIPMRDLIVVLPGITGSILQKDGRDVWNISIAAAWNAMRTLGGSLEALVPAHDDPDVDDLGDGITATGLIRGVSIIPGFHKLDGYGPLLKRITSRFEVTLGTPDAPGPINLIEFPYDWRRGNLYGARRLKRLIDERLAAWRAHSGARDAKVILIAHSMGGLISRYYLEVLEGWHDCKMLVTLGTPYSGSLAAVNSIANGIKAPSLDLTRVIRACRSIYELLPVYPIIKANGEYQRLTECGPLADFNMQWVADARKFHKEIRDAVDARMAGDGANAYKVIPIVGLHQPTLQSAVLTDGQLAMTGELPTVIDSLLDLGDGTVPQCSAIPPELVGQPLSDFVAEKHGSLQCNESVLDKLEETLRSTQVRGPMPFYGQSERPMIGVTLEDIYREGVPIEVSATLTDPGDNDELRVKLTCASESRPPVIRPMTQEGARLVARVEGVPAGVWRVEVAAVTEAPGSPTPVHDLCQVVSR